MKVLLTLFIIPLFWSCKNTPNKGISIYKFGRTWIYKVAIKDSLGNVKDTFHLVMQAKKPSTIQKLMFPIILNYKYIKGDSLLKKAWTGVHENEQQVSIHPPREYKLDITEVLPFPSADKRMSNKSWKWFKSETNMNIQKASYFDKGENKEVNLAGYTIKQNLCVSDTTTFKYTGKNLFCFLLKGKNTSHIKDLGQFQCAYYFNHKYGFVKLIYLPPWGDKIIIKLEKASF